ncbi:MAG: GNAT family N-acetyltransferase [Clostridia bacterium]|nr:GNAT family N-acetyltransferase [Clostridia bacterium]
MENMPWADIAKSSNLRLLTCSELSVTAFSDMLDDYIAAGTPFLGMCDPDDYYPFERICYFHSKGKYLPRSNTAYTRYFLCDEKGTVYAQGDVRHESNHEQTYYSGYIGYGVLPSKRGCGYGSIMCAKLLEKASEFYSDVIITCRDDNLPSRRVIEKNGGVLLDMRYWIKQESIMRRYSVRVR